MSRPSSPAETSVDGEPGLTQPRLLGTQNGYRLAMYFDSRPCAVCGSEVKLRPRRAPEPDDGPVGAAPGQTGDADPTVDERVCTSASCATHEAGGPEA